MKIINDLIKELIEIRETHGDIFVRTQVQVGHLVDVNYRIDILYNENKTFKLPILIIEGFKR
jgi:hypothetical protein